MTIPKHCIFCFALLFSSVAFSAFELQELQLRGWLGDAEAQFRLGLKAERLERNIPKAMGLYRQAAQKKHPDATNRLAVLLENQGHITEAVELHRAVVNSGKWNTRGAFSSLPPKPHEIQRGANPKALQFAPLPAANPSMRFVFDNTWFELPSPEAASAFRLGFLYRAGNKDNGNLEPDTKNSDFFYNEAFRFNGSAALIGAVLADSFDEHREAVKWFERGRKQPRYPSFSLYRKGKSHEALEEYSEAVASYKKATQTELKTKEDFKFQILSLLRLAELHEQGVPEAGVTADKRLSKIFRGKAFRLGRLAVTQAHIEDSVWIKEINQSHFQGTHTNAGYRVYHNRIIEISQIHLLYPEFDSPLYNFLARKTAYRLGIARKIANYYDTGYRDTQEPTQLELALFWYDIAYINGEIFVDHYREAIVRYREAIFRLSETAMTQTTCEGAMKMLWPLID